MNPIHALAAALSPQAAGPANPMFVLAAKLSPAAGGPNFTAKCQLTDAIKPLATTITDNAIGVAQYLGPTFLILGVVGLVVLATTRHRVGLIRWLAWTAAALITLGLIGTVIAIFVHSSC